MQRGIRRTKVAAVFALVFSLNSFCAPARAQDASSTADFAHVYEAVCNRLFPVVNLDRAPNRARNILLKNHGTFVYTEMQIVIWQQGTVQERYEVWQLPTGAPSIFQQAIKLRDSLKTDDPNVLASSIRVEHRTIERPSKTLIETAQQLSKLTFPPTLDQGMVLDGITYSIDIESLSNNTRIELAGGEPRFTAHPLIKWYGAMRSAVEAELKAK